MIRCGQYVIGLKARVMGPCANAGAVGIIMCRCRESTGWYEVMFPENTWTIPYSHRELDLVR